MHAHEKYSIGCAIAEQLLRKIHLDLEVAKGITQQHLAQFDSAQAVKYQIKNPGRAVRTRLYFTSESHIHSLLNCLRYSASSLSSDCAAAGLIPSPEGRAFLDGCEFDYLTHIVFQVFEDMAAEPGDVTRFRVCLYVSPGVRQLRQDDFAGSSGCGSAPDGASDPTVGGLFEVQKPVLLCDSLRLDQVQQHLHDCFTFHDSASSTGERER